MTVWPTHLEAGEGLCEAVLLLGRRPALGQLVDLAAYIVQEPLQCIICPQAKYFLEAE